LSRAAVVWLVQYYASGEVAWRLQPRSENEVRPAGYFNDPGESTRRSDRALGLSQRLQPSLPDLFADPLVAFPMAAAQRRQAQGRLAQRLYATQRQGAGDDPWTACAAGEQWLVEQKGKRPKATLVCPTVQNRPRLDGRLDDAIWEEAATAELHSPLADDAAWPAKVLLARDEEFLYVAIRAKQAPGGKYETTPGTRTRDADLSARDRVEILLDLDRDYATYYRLVIDSRGWTAEDCWGDCTWDPAWYVGAATADGEWVAEAAIPLKQLAPEVPAGAAWAIGLQRVVPGVGFQSWSRPAAAEVIPEGFGLLLFR
jgi:hypothetical protein